jgi:intracellular multiplication protein IcmL
MALKDAIGTVINRNAFYRDGYRLMLRVSLIQLGVIALLIMTVIGLVLTVQTKQIYFATTSDGRIIPIVPLSEEFRTKAEVITWAAETSKSVMTFDYNDYRAHLQQASYSFTTTGWDSFNKALQDANLLDAVQKRKLVVSMDIKAAPEVISAGMRLIGGAQVYTWDVKFPVVIRYDGAESPQPTFAKLLLRIVRVSTLQNPDGISIEQWVVSADSAQGEK